MRRKDREIKDQEKMLAIMHDCDCCRIGLTAGKKAESPTCFANRKL